MKPPDAKKRKKSILLKNRLRQYFENLSYRFLDIVQKNKFLASEPLKTAPKALNKFLSLILLQITSSVAYLQMGKSLN